MIKVSEQAKTKLTQLMSEDGFDIAQDYVRVGVKSGGCSGLSYDLKFDKKLLLSTTIFTWLSSKSLSPSTCSLSNFKS